MILHEIWLRNEDLCHDGQQFHQYQQSKQSPVTSKSLKCNVGNPGTALGQ